ncbi:hypothetical protein [Carboxylicivirga taeanensis]|uniref:hypothetical protein n=1 Tax=Carboxylicivirga taeanensis TaxID=1416875 RepID=UPI003F6E0C97
MEDKKLEKSIQRFTAWLDSYGEYSYDVKDFFSTWLGINGKKLFYKNRLAGLPFAALAIFIENFFPSAVHPFVKKRRESIADAHYAMAYMNLYEVFCQKSDLRKAEHYLDELYKSSLKVNYSGHCWGYTFGWQNSGGFCGPGTPFITVTPYPFQAFLQHYRLTNDETSKATALSVMQFALNDLNKVQLPNGTRCYSYSPVDRRAVVNANAYLLGVLASAYELRPDDLVKKEAMEVFNFIASYQNEDGSWFYDAVHPGDRFIDNFHTCFTIKGLIAFNRVFQHPEAPNVIRKGLTYYQNRLLRSDYTPVPYASGKKQKMSKYEAYDFAEAISLFIMAEPFLKEGVAIAGKIAEFLIDNMQLSDGHFVTRISQLGSRNTIPYHRWPQAQLFYALTNLTKTNKLCVALQES